MKKQQKPAKTSSSKRKGTTSAEVSPSVVADQKPATKHAGGRPPKFANPEDFQSVIESYFAECLNTKAPATVAGLCVALDLTKQGLIEYGQKPLFSDLVKNAKLRIEADVESRLFGPNPAGSIFWLKNHAGYVDKQVNEHSGPGGGPIQYSDLERANRLATLLQTAAGRKNGKRG